MNHLNERSLQMINTIYNNFSSHPTFSKYQIETVNDFRNGIVNLDISLNGNLRNKFMFCPDLNGNIGSVAIYGAELEGHLTYIIHSGFISGYQNRYGDNLKPPTNVYHRMTA